MQASIVLALCFALLAGCSTEEALIEGPTEPAPLLGTLEVGVRAEGALPDPDGFAVVLNVEGEGDRPAQQAASLGGTIRFPDLPAGTHAVRLESVAENCQITNGGSIRPITLAAGATRELAFVVYCRGPGTVLVRTVSRGRDLDPDGYVVAFEGMAAPREAPIGANDTLRINEEDFPPEQLWTLRLSGVADNCLVVSPNPGRPAPFFRDQPSHLVFSVTCIQRGSKIVFGRDGEVFLAQLDGGVVNLTNHPAFDHGPSLSPDRRRVLFSSDRDRPEGDLYILDLGSGGVTRLAAGPGFHHVGQQAWSPDGSRVVFSSNGEDSTSSLYVMNVDGSGIVRLTHDPQATDLRPAWSPDGARIAFCRSRGGDDVPYEIGIYRMNADGSGIVKLADDGCGPVWSSAGDRIAFSGGIIDEFEPSYVAIVDAAGTGPASRVVAGWSPSWSPDGTAIAYTALGGMTWIGNLVGNSVVESLAFLPGAELSWR